MKKVLVVLAIMVCLSSALYAEVGYGSKAFVGFPRYIGDEVFTEYGKQESKLSFGGNVQVEFIINDYFGIQTEPGVSLKMLGFAETYSDTWFFISVPVYAKAKLPTDNAEFYLMAGPAVDFNILGKEILDNSNFLLYGYNVEAGVGFPVAEGLGSIGIRVGSHFNNLSKDLEMDILSIDLVGGYMVKSFNPKKDNKDKKEEEK